MVDSLRAALRLLPAVRPSIGGTNIGGCSRVSKARIYSAPEQSALLALKVHPQIINCEKALPGGVGIVRFARAVLAYVGAGLSAVTANQLTGPSIVQAKELGVNHTIGATEAGGMWQRTSASRHVVQEDAIRSPKFAHCPLPHIVSKSQADASYSVGHSYYWNSSWGPADVRFSPDTKLDPQKHSSPSTNRDYRLKLGGLDENLNSRFSKPTGLQALAAESNFSMKSSAGLMSSVSDYSATAEIELEWQLIVDPKSKAGLGDPICDSRVCEENEEGTFDETVGSTTEQEVPGKVQLVNDSDVGTSQIMTKTDKEIMTKSSKETMVAFGSLDGNSVDRQSIQTAKKEVSQQDSRMAMEKNLLSWTVDREAVVPVVTRKAAERLENFEPPTRSAMSMSGMSLSSFDISTSTEKQGDSFRSFDKILLTSILHGDEPTRFDYSGLPSSALLPGRSDPASAAPVHFQKVSQPLTIPTVEARPSARHGSHSLSSDNRNTSWNEGGATSMTAERGSGLLGEALCHSQTRAREAERKAQQANDEKERLVRLFFREASRSLTYEHLVTSLQAENMWLRKLAPNESLTWLHHSFVDPFSVVGRMSSRSWKDLGEDYARRRLEHNVSAMHQKAAVDLGESGSNDLVMGCTLGIAFALGLSLAGAGLMLGWSMGWILLAYSVSV